MIKKVLKITGIIIGIVLVCYLLFYLFIYLWLNFSLRSTPVKFNDGLIAGIKETYGITLPVTAEYHGGYTDNAFRDPKVYLGFTVTADEFDRLCSHVWIVKPVDYPGPFTPNDKFLAVEDGWTPDGEWEHLGVSGTPGFARTATLWYKKLPSGKYQCYFRGDYFKYE